MRLGIYHPAITALQTVIIEKNSYCDDYISTVYYAHMAALTLKQITHSGTMSDDNMASLIITNCGNVTVGLREVGFCPSAFLQSYGSL